jgi:NADH-quinone oxidoreductase subunit M
VSSFAWNRPAGFLAVVGAVLAAAYMLRLLKQIVWGREDKRDIRDMNLREVIYLLPLGVLVIWIGLFPQPLIRMMEKTLGHLLVQLQVFSH